MMLNKVDDDDDSKNSIQCDGKYRDCVSLCKLLHKEEEERIRFACTFMYTIICSVGFQFNQDENKREEKRSFLKYKS